MKHILLFFALSMGLTYCKNDPKQEPAPEQGAATRSMQSPPPVAGGEIPKDLQQVRGLLVISLGHPAMISPQIKAMFEIRDMTKTLDSAYVEATKPCPYPFEPVFAVISGKFSGPPSNPEGVFDLYRIDTIQSKSPENLTSLGAPFEFWCHGSNPKWDIQVSRFETGIFYQNHTDSTAWFGRWVVPTIKGDTWIYDVKGIDESPGHMLLKIKKERTKDPVTNEVYDFSVEFSFNGQKKLKGVALNGMPEELLRKTKNE